MFITPAAVAQSVEQRTENPCVNSSILFGGKSEPYGSLFLFAVGFNAPPSGVAQKGVAARMCRRYQRCFTLPSNFAAFFLAKSTKIGILVLRYYHKNLRSFYELC